MPYERLSDLIPDISFEADDRDGVIAPGNIGTTADGQLTVGVQFQWDGAHGDYRILNNADGPFMGPYNSTYTGYWVGSGAGTHVACRSDSNACLLGRSNGSNLREFFVNGALVGSEPNNADAGTWRYQTKGASNVIRHIFFSPRRFTDAEILIYAGFMNRRRLLTGQRIVRSVAITGDSIVDGASAGAGHKPDELMIEAMQPCFNISYALSGKAYVGTSGNGNVTEDLVKGRMMGLAALIGEGSIAFWLADSNNMALQDRSAAETLADKFAGIDILLEGNGESGCGKFDVVVTSTTIARTGEDFTTINASTITEAATYPGNVIVANPAADSAFQNPADSTYYVNNGTDDNGTHPNNTGSDRLANLHWIPAMEEAVSSLEATTTRPLPRLSLGLGIGL